MHFTCDAANVFWHQTDQLIVQPAVFSCHAPKVSNNVSTGFNHVRAQFCAFVDSETARKGQRSMYIERSSLNGQSLADVVQLRQSCRDNARHGAPTEVVPLLIAARSLKS